MDIEVKKTGLCLPTEEIIKGEEIKRVLMEILPREVISCEKKCPLCPPKSGDFRRVQILP